MRSKRCGGLQLIAAMQKTIKYDLCAQIEGLNEPGDQKNSPLLVCYSTLANSALDALDTTRLRDETIALARIDGHRPSRSHVGARAPLVCRSQGFGPCG